jgi:hypothetical protein
MDRLLSAMSRKFRRPKSPAAGKRKARRQLRLELLEDRTVPTAVAVPSGIQSWWAGDGNATDRVGSNPGTLNGNVTFATGEVSQAFQFDTTDYVSANTTNLPTGNSNRTLEMWVKANSFPTPGEAYFAGYGNFGTNNQTYHVGTSGSTLFWSQWGSAILGPTLNTNQWYHIAVTNVGNTATLYLNGQAVGSATVTIDTPAGSPFYIGRIPGSNGDTRKLNGLVDEVSVYNRALSPIELQAIYEAGHDGKVISPVAVDFPSVVDGSGGATTPVTFTITRTGSLSGSLTVNWTTADDTAIAGTNYTAASGTVTFADGQATQTVTVNTLDDGIIDPNLDFKLIVTPSGGTSAMSLATILNDDTTILVGNDTVMEGATSIRSLGAFVPSQGSTLSNARGIEFGPDGNVYVTSEFPGYVNRYDHVTGRLLGVFASNPLLDGAKDLAFGPDGNLYVTNDVSNDVLRFNGTTGAFIGVFVTSGSGGLSNARALTFGPDGNLYVTSANTNSVLRFDGVTGAFKDAFVPAGSGGLVDPTALDFGPDGNLYVASGGHTVTNNSILRYNGSTGAFLGTFVSAGSGGLTLAPVAGVVFGPDLTQDGTPELYVSNAGGNNVLVFDGHSGAFLKAYVASSLGGLSDPKGLLFDTNNNLFVVSNGNNSIQRYGAASQFAFTVSLASTTAGTTTVSYATADGTALAGRDYTSVSGTLTFPPGLTAQTIVVPTLDDGVADPTKAFTVNLSNPTSGVITSGQAIGTILDDTKFYVVDGGASDSTYQYASSGGALGNNALGSGDIAPRGVATTAAGTTEWVLDANKNVYVYSTGGILLGSWSAGGLSSSATLTGIATNGTDIWLVDSSSATVYKYTGAASRLSGSQTAASSFGLTKGRAGNSNPQDIVTDGTSFWVVDGSSLRVFKYTLSGSSLGSWKIDPANTHPTGITINPNNVSDIWIVDNGTDKVYQYVGAASRTSGSQNAAASLALAANNTNPQGIADPPVPGTISVPPPAPLTAVASPAVLAALSAVKPGLPAPAASGREALFALLGSATSGGSFNPITQRAAFTNVMANQPLSPEAVPSAAQLPSSRIDAIFAGSQREADDVLLDVPLFPEPSQDQAGDAKQPDGSDAPPQDTEYLPSGLARF